MRTSICVGMLLLGLAARGTTAVWQPAIEDSFTLAPPTRTVGVRLDGFAPEKGTGLWRQHGNDATFQLAADGGLVSGNACGGKTIALVDCRPAGDYRMQLEADVRPGGSQWVALGWGKDSDFFWSRAPLWLTIGGSREPAAEGDITLYADGTRRTLKTARGADCGYDREKPVHVALQLDAKTRAVTLLANGKTLLEGLRLADLPVITTAGVMCNFPELNDPRMRVERFRVSLQGGEIQARPMSTKSVVEIDATAVKRTNLGWGSADLMAETSLEPTAPYFAEFDFGLNPEAGGKYACWALVLACNEPYISEWSWQLDGGPAQRGVAQEGSAAGMPRWVRFGEAELTPGTHRLRFEVTGRRSFPDDAYLFHLWKVVLAPSDEEFQPWLVNVELGYNPQGNATGQQAGSTGQGKQQGRVSAYRSEIAASVAFQLSLTNVLQHVQPIWRDYSECENLNWHIPYLIKPLRPRVIRAQHVLSGAIRKLGADGKPDYDFTVAHNAIRAIHDVGAEPMIGLDNPPTALYPKDAKGKLLPPSAWAGNAAFEKAWGDTVTAFLQSLRDDHLTVKMLHCFNEPEFSYKNIPASIMLHRVAAQAVKHFDPSLQMIGIGCGNAKSPVYFAFLDYLQKHPENIDIFDYHQYQTTPAMHARLLREARAELDRRGLQRVRIAVTEWGISSSAHEDHRVGLRYATQNAACIKAMAETGLADMANLFNIRDYDNYRIGLITWDGYLKPAYWGQWLWAQLPEENDRLAVAGGDDRVQGFAFRDGAGIAMLVWYDAPENSPHRKVSVGLPAESWAGYTVRQWRLDATRQIGYVPDGAPVELPYEVVSKPFKTPAAPAFSFEMLPASMRLIKLQPLAAGQEPVKPRPNLLDNPEFYHDAK